MEVAVTIQKDRFSVLDSVGNARVLFAWLEKYKLGNET